MPSISPSLGCRVVADIDNGIFSRSFTNFVTVDLARKTDGNLIIMEMGDGQVSGLQQIGADEFYRGFHNQSKENIYSIDYVKNTLRD